MAPDRFHEEGLRFLQHQFSSLSSCERDVLDCLLAQQSAEQIAENLELPVRYVADCSVRLMKIFGAVDMEDLERKVVLTR